MMNKYEDMGYDTASRGWGPYSPTWIPLFSEFWYSWHRGWAKYSKDRAAEMEQDQFAILANKYQRQADLALS